MTAPHDVVAIKTALHPSSLDPEALRDWAPRFRQDPLALLDCEARKWIDLYLRNGQRVRVRLLREARRWRPHDCNRFTALPDIRHLIPAATRGHRRIAVRLRNGRTCHGDPSGFVWTSCGSATIKGWRPA